jgi:hypothetical protein
MVVCGLFGHGQHKQKEHHIGALYKGAVDLAYVLETEVIYLDTEAFALKFSFSKRKVNNEGMRINGPAL